jgi:hypothetical protein
MMTCWAAGWLIRPGGEFVSASADAWKDGRHGDRFRDPSGVDMHLVFTPRLEAVLQQAFEVGIGLGCKTHLTA